MRDELRTEDADVRTWADGVVRLSVRYRVVDDLPYCDRGCIAYSDCAEKSPSGLCVAVVRRIVGEVADALYGESDE